MPTILYVIFMAIPYGLTMPPTVELRKLGDISLSEAVDFACGQASASSTEFLGESRIALRRILSEENGILTDLQRSDLNDILRQINHAFEK